MTWLVEKLGLRNKTSKATPVPSPPVEHELQPEKINPLNAAIEEALKQSQRKIIVFCDGVNPQEIVDIYTKSQDKCHVSSVQDLLEKPREAGVRPTQGTNTWIITGYSRDLQVADIQTEKYLQAVVREQMGRQIAYQLIILSSTLPHEEFQTVQFPWFNGPFEEDFVWSIKKDGETFVLKKYKIESTWDMTIPGQPKTERKWIEETNYRFEQ